MDANEAMKVALELARKAQELGEVPVGAVIVKDDVIIGQGFNQRESLNDPLAHAELIAIRQAAQHLNSWRLVECTLFVTLEPCAMCAGALVQSRLARLVYAASDPKGGAIESHLGIASYKPFNHQVEITKGILQAEASYLLSQFFAQLRISKKKN